jgi:Fe-S-cluster containining protein
MNVPHDDTSEKIDVTAAITVSGKRLELAMSVPAGPTKPLRMLPLFHSLTETFVGVAEANARDSGLEVSCRKGCGACCRQLVPISETEAYHLRDLVTDLPEPRRSEVLARFEAARQRVREADLTGILHEPERADREAIEALIFDYFHLGIACPFLEEESCSIHTERPTACREYLVVSPAENCARFEPEGIKRLKIPVRVSKAVRCFDAGQGALPNRWIPLIFALEWADAHPDESAPRPGPELLREMFSRLIGQEVPEPKTYDDGEQLGK